MSSSPVDRVGLDHFVAAVPALRARGEDRIADELAAAARHFCRSLALHRRSPAYRGRLKPPIALGVERLGAALVQAHDVLRLGTEDEVALGSWCCALAARLHVVAHVPDIRQSRLLAFVNIDARGFGELVLAPVSDQDLASASRPSAGGCR